MRTKSWSLVLLTTVLGITLFAQAGSIPLPTFITVSPVDTTMTNLNFTEQFTAQSGDTGDVFPLPGVHAVQLDAGQHGCAVLNDRTVHCWPNGPYWPAIGPLPILGLGQVAAVTDAGGGIDHTCVLLVDTTVKCWGANFFGMLGDGTTTSSETPVTVIESNGSPLINVAAISAGTYHTCALLLDTTVKCWGDNGSSGQGTNGALGDPATVGSFSTTPVYVSGFSGGIAISAGGNHTCAVLSNTRVQCWGGNAFGELGDPGSVSNYRATPVFVTGLTGAKTVSTEGFHSTCALLLDETVRCWGYNNAGQLGNGTTTNSSTPVTVTGLAAVKTVSVGNGFACASIGDGTVSCWGGNPYGNLGNGTTSNSSVPVTVSDLTNAVAVSAGTVQACALLADTTVSCWGLNNTGQLGTGSFFPSQRATPGATAALGRVAWTSSDQGVAIMDAFWGTASSQASGTTTITAYYGPLTASTTLTVAVASNPPVAQDDSLSTNEDTAASVDLLANDSDPDGDSLTVSITSQPAHGVLTYLSDGVYRYTPVANYNGPDSFTYVANDGTTDSNEATVSITVMPVNDAPVAVADSFTTDEDNALTVGASAVLTNDTDVDGDVLSAVLVTGPSVGTLNFNTNGEFTYTPPSNFYGSVTFTYKASDNVAFSADTTVTIAVTPVNDPPVANPDSGFTVAEDGSLTIPAASLTANDTDPDNDPLTPVKESDPAHGTLTVNANGSFTYLPAPNYFGPDSFTYKASDGQLFSNVVSVSITVTPSPDPPVAKNDFYSISQNSNGASVLANDTSVDGGPLTAMLVTSPAHGTLTFNANDGTFVYVPASPTSGPDSFTYKAINNGLASNVATVFVNNTCSISWKDSVSGLWQDATNWDQGRAPTATDDVCIGLDGNYAVTIQGNQAATSVTIAGSVVGTRLLINGTSTTDATLTVSNDVFNSSTINLQGESNVGLVVSGRLRNLPLAWIGVFQGTLPRTLSVNLDNDGYVSLAGETTFTGGAIVNRSTFVAGGKVRFNGTAVTQDASQFGVDGDVRMSGGSFTFNGGTIARGLVNNGTIFLQDSTLNFNASSQAVFRLEGACTITGGIWGTVTVASGSSASLTVAGDFTNHGVLAFVAGTTPGGQTLDIVSGTLTNDGAFDLIQTDGLSVTGDIVNNGLVDLGGPTTFGNSAITNQGTFQVAHLLTLNGTHFTQASGSLVVAAVFSAPSNFMMTNGTFNFANGMINARLALHDSLLNSSPSTGSGEFLMTGASAVTGAIRSGERVTALWSPGGTTLNAQGGVINEGILGVDTADASTGAVTLAVTSGTLTNTGVLFLDGQTQSVRRTLSGDVLNQGTVDFRNTGEFAGGLFTNTGVVRLPPFTAADITAGTFKNIAPGWVTGAALRIGSGAKVLGTGTITAAVSNAGELNPGLSPGQLNIVGSFVQEASGVLVAEINGPTVGVDYDQLTVAGAVSLTGGTLRVQVAGGGFCPDGAFRVISAFSLVGDFSTKTINNPSASTATAAPGSTSYDVTFTGCGNHPPLGVDDTATTAQDTPAVVSVLANDTDPDNDVLTITGVTQPGHGTTAINNGTTITYTPAAGYSGPDSFQYSISDGNGGTATATVTITVTPAAPTDTTPPQITLRGALTREAIGPSGAPILYSASATDLVDGPVPVACTPPPGSVFPLGASTIVCTATDSSGNTATASFAVLIVDTTPPTLTLPGNLTVPATTSSGAVVIYSVSATDTVSAVTVNCSPLSGAAFPIGMTTVNCSASDASGNTVSGSFIVTVTGAATQVTDLIEVVNSFNLSNGLRNSLVQKLVAARDLINSGRSACGKLDDFINAVKAQTGKEITQAQATALIAGATAIKTLLGCL